MPREPVTETIVGHQATSLPLPFEKAQALIPEVMRIIGIIGEKIGELMRAGLKTSDDALKLAPLLDGLGAYLGGGKLDVLAPKFLASTSVVVDGQNFELMKDAHRKELFDAHPDLFFPLVLFAAKVTFLRFFPAGVLKDAATQKQPD